MTVWSEGANQSLAYSFTMKMQLLHTAPEGEADLGSLDDGLNRDRDAIRRQPWLPPEPSAQKRRSDSIEQILDQSEGSPRNSLNQAP